MLLYSVCMFVCIYVYTLILNISLEIVWMKTLQGNREFSGRTVFSHSIAFWSIEFYNFWSALMYLSWGNWRALLFWKMKDEHCLSDSPHIKILHMLALSFNSIRTGILKYRSQFLQYFLVFLSSTDLVFSSVQRQKKSYCKTVLFQGAAAQVS